MPNPQVTFASYFCDRKVHMVFLATDDRACYQVNTDFLQGFGGCWLL